MEYEKVKFRGDLVLNLREPIYHIRKDIVSAVAVAVANALKKLREVLTVSDMILQQRPGFSVTFIL